MHDFNIICLVVSSVVFDDPFNMFFSHELVIRRVQKIDGYRCL